MTVQQSALSWALSQVGKQGYSYAATEIWGKLYPEGKGWAWCAAFVTRAYQVAGVDIRKGVNWPYYCPYLENWAKRIGAWKTTRANAGDLVLYDWGGDGVADHVGIAYPDENSSYYRAVEGNTSSGSYGSQSNGGGVWIRYRSRSTIRGWIDMGVALAHLGVSSTSKISSTTSVASADRVNGNKRNATDNARELVVSGTLGTATIRRWQEVMGTPIDGVISKPSTLVRKWQTYLNSVVGAKDQNNLHGAASLAVDGYLGPKSWKVFQFVAFNWCKQFNNGQSVIQFCDGEPGPLTYKSLQWMLNRSWKGSGKLLKK